MRFISGQGVVNACPVNAPRKGWSNTASKIIAICRISQEKLFCAYKSSEAGCCIRPAC